MTDIHCTALYLVLKWRYGKKVMQGLQVLKNGTLLECLYCILCEVVRNNVLSLFFVSVCLLRYAVDLVVELVSIVGFLSF